MKYFSITVILFTLVLCDITCPSGKVYAKFTKKCTTSAGEESYEIWSGDVKLEQSPTFVNNELRVIEYCLDASSNSQYTLKLKDTWGDSWTNGAYLQIDAVDGNTIFKNFMYNAGGDEYTISFYYGANKNDQWKMTSSTVSGTWYEYSFPDSNWNLVTLGSVTTSVSGTQYFRKTFAGLSGMAAYELSMNYRYGVVAYMNGVEIYRDNMPDGTVTSTTPASGSYATVSYHSLIRPGSEVANDQSVVAVELHFTEGTSQSTVDFNAFLALLGSSMLHDNCFVYPYDKTITASFSTTYGDRVFDYQYSVALSITAANLPATFTIAFDHRPYINGLYSYPYSLPSTTVNTFSMQGTNNPTGDWTTVLSADAMTYTSKEWAMVSGYFNAGLYSNYRLNAVSSSSSSAYIYEMQFVTCSIGIPTTIEFSAPSYTYYTKYEEIEIKPIVPEFVNCQITPPAPEGLTFDSATCTLSGKASTPATTTFTVTSVVNTQTFTGSFTLNVMDCTGTMISILRTYKTYSVREAFTVMDAATQAIALEIEISSSQVNSVDKEYILCLTGQKYIITTSSSTLYWQGLSFLYVRGIFGEGEYDTMLRAKYDTNLGLPTSYSLNVNYSIKPSETWNYVMGTVPTNWYSTAPSDWSSGSAGSFPASTNQIQLYKKTFNLNSVQEMAGLVISLKYQYGVLIYLNNHEVFRLGITGDLTNESTATTSQTTVAWRQISLPIKTFATDSTPSVDYVVAGSNTIAIALISGGPSMTAATFDCAFRLMGDASTSRVYDFTTTSSGMSGSTLANSNILHFYFSNTLYHSTCTNNHFSITFNNDRHEWISSVTIKLHYTQTAQYPRQFVLKAKNAEDETWTTLKTVTGLTWSIAGQETRIWVSNNKSYNQYRFENFGSGNPSACHWKLGQLNLLSDPTNIQVPPLSYESTSIFKDIEMAEVFANSEYYHEFTISPPLPAGLTIDPNTGTISGTASEYQETTTYTISAKKYTGESTSTTFTLAVELCYGGRNLITLVARMDSSPTTASYSLYQGKGTTGTAIKQDIGFVTASNLNYADFCLNHGIYTLQLKDTTSTGWSLPGGYFLTVDVGEMKFEMGQVYTKTTPTLVTTMFSSYLPFQIEYDDWKVYKDAAAVATNWNAVAFDDAAWTSMKAAAIGTSEAVTVYIRHDITLDDVSNYQVLNVRVKYAGGIVCYFNGRKVARFNLVDSFTASTESIELHDSTTFSRFHIVLPTVKAVTGKNVIAFEVHRPYGQSSAEPVVFDATGVFGVNDCSLGVDTVIDVTGSTFSAIGSLENFFDYTPVTYGYISNTVGSYLQWTVENLEGTRFNSFALETTYARTSFGFSLYGRFTPSQDEEDPNTEEYTSMFAEVDLSTVERARTAWSVPVGIANFRQFKWEIDDTAPSAVYASGYILQYCKASGEGVCDGIDEYPTVAEGQISPASCGYGFRGYAYRLCSGGVLGEVQMDKCVYKVPTDLLYETERYIIVKDVQIHIPAPTFTNIITRFYLAENTFLPAGLTLDEVTGAITGMATEESNIKSYTIYGENPAGAVSTTMSINVRKGECKAEGNFPKTTVDEIAEYDCALQGSYVGTQTRACLLGTKDGEWQKISGVCIGIPTIIILVVLVIIILAVVVFFLMRTTKKTKAVGGVKGKKGKQTSSAKKMNKKTPAKTVKV